MRDDRMKWAPPPDDFPTVSLKTVSVTSFSVGRQYLISGASFATNHGTSSGWSTPVCGDVYEVRLKRDQVLTVGGPERETGWNTENARAVSDMTDAYYVFSVFGERALEVLRRSAELDPKLPSRSVARRLWGTDVLLYRHGDEHTFRLHVIRSEAVSVYQKLILAVKQVD